MTLPTTLDERSACDVLLARAFETQDPQGLLIAPTERSRLDRRPVDRTSRETHPADDELPRDEGQRALATLLRRARVVRELAETRYPAVSKALRSAGSGRLVALLAVPLAFLAGAFADPLGPPKHVNLLSGFLFGMLAWNLAVYLALIVLPLVRARPRLTLPHLATGLTAWFAAPERSWMRATSGTESALLGDVLRAFLADWLRVGAPLHLARARTALHLGALAFAAGAVCGLYVRGIALQYEAAWESTFLDAGAVHALLSTVLAPASSVTGLELPSAAELERVWRIRDGGGGGNAALWIHLYAVTLGLFVGLPRLALAGVSASKAARLSRALPFPLDDATLLRWSAGERGRGVRVVVLPYSTGPTSEASSEALRGLLADVLGARATIELSAPLDYGAEPPGHEPQREPRQGPADDAPIVVLFNLAQSPEHEVHARFVEELAGHNGTPPVLVLLDESGLRATLGAGEAAEERLAERRKSWANALRGTGAEALAVDLARPVSDEVLTRAREVLAP